MTPSGMMEERGRGGVVQDFQTGGSDPEKHVISERVMGDETVPGWVVSIEVSKDKGVRGLGSLEGCQDRRSRCENQKSASDRRGVEVKEL